MNISNLITPDTILYRVRAENKTAFIERMLDCYLEHTPEHLVEGYSKKELLGHLLDREKTQSTGLGNGLAFPHARIPGYRHTGMVVAIPEEPMEWDSQDGSLVNMVFMVLNPTEQPSVPLKIWSALARLIRKTDFGERVLHAGSAEGVYALFREKDISLESDLRARDIMVQPYFKVSPNDKLPLITHNLWRYREPATSVVNDEGCIVGELSADAIFQYGMPDFFKQLESVSFVRHFNPLEKYLCDEANRRASDIMQTDFATLPPDATLVEIIFLLAVKRHYKVYIVDEGKLVGQIGRNAVLDRAINF